MSWHSEIMSRFRGTPTSIDSAPLLLLDLRYTGHVRSRLLPPRTHMATKLGAISHDHTERPSSASTILLSGDGAQRGKQQRYILTPTTVAHQTDAPDLAL